MAEIQQGTAGRFGLLKQSAFNTIQSSDGSFHYFPFISCGYGVQQGVGQLPTESGNSKALGGGTYKTGAWAAGNVDIIPRMDNRIYHLLEGVFGDASTYTDQTIAQVIADSGSEVGVNTHLFGFADGSEFDIPWFTTHRLLPHSTASSQVGEITQDARIGNFMLTAGAGAYATSRLGLLGRVNNATVFDLNPGWAAPTLDDSDTYLLTTCAGSVKLSVTDGTPSTLTEFDVGNVMMGVTNNLTGPNDLRKIGSMHPISYTVLSRTIVFQTTFFISDYDFYVQVFCGGADPVIDAGVSCTPVAGDIDITLQSPAVIGSTSEYHEMRIRTTQANVQWTAAPLVLVPDQPVLIQATGTLKRVDAGRDIECYIQNGQASY